MYANDNEPIPLNKGAVNPEVGNLRSIPQSPSFNNVSEINLHGANCAISRQDPRVAMSVTHKHLQSSEYIPPLPASDVNEGPLSRRVIAAAQASPGAPVAPEIAKRWGVSGPGDISGAAIAAFEADMHTALKNAQNGVVRQYESPNAPIVTVGPPVYDKEFENIEKMNSLRDETTTRVQRALNELAVKDVIKSNIALKKKLKSTLALPHINSRTALALTGASMAFYFWYNQS
jgi:hypothetical protein